MAARERRALTSVPVVAGQTYQTEFQGAPFNRVSTQLSGTYTASGDGTGALEASLGFGGRFTLVQNEEPLIDVAGEDLRYVAAFQMGGTAEIGPGAMAAAGGIVLGQADIDLQAFLPGTAIDARRNKVIRRGQFLPLTRLGNTATGITGTLKTGVETAEIVAETWFEPRWKQAIIRCDVASSELSYTYRVGKQREYMGGILLRQYDASELLVSANAARPDGLVRNVTVELSNREGTRTLWKGSWGELKHYQQSKYGWPRSEVHTGVSLITFDDPETPEINEVLELEVGDQLTVKVDTLSAVDSHFPTVTTPASGDECIVTFFSHVLRGVGAGEGDTADAQRASADIQRRQNRQAQRSESRTARSRG